MRILKHLVIMNCDIVNSNPPLLSIWIKTLYNDSEPFLLLKVINSKL